MYKQEAVINGVLCAKYSPDGKWEPYTPEELTSRIMLITETLNRAILCLPNIKMSNGGTTCLAASQAGRQYIGIDANEEFCRVARRRVSSPNPH